MKMINQDLLMVGSHEFKTGSDDYLGGILTSSRV